MTMSIHVNSDSIAGVYDSIFAPTLSTSNYPAPDEVYIWLVGHPTQFGLRTSIDQPNKRLYVTAIEASGSFESMGATDSFHFWIFGLVGSR